MANFTQAEVDDSIRDVTEQELADLHQNGWVVLRSLIAPALAKELFLRVEPLLGSPKLDGDFGVARQPSAEDPLFHSVVFSERMGRNALRLLRVMVPTGANSIRYWTDNIFLKMPEGQGKADGPTKFHQDFQIDHGTLEDRVSKVNFWVALHDLPPHQSTLRFYSGSHKLGILGPRKDPEGRSITDVYPRLAEWCTLSQPLHLAPGDATVHNSLTVHGAPSNTTTEARRNLEFVYIDPEARSNGIITTLDYGQANVKLEPGKPFAKPLVYTE
ncbi:MAG TPA: phytanoyl-CoA dioxygenase family protein [Trebonia sp.]|jgi:hypothetical protein|nr:phytanoyl-CoA dioxygenase family protein [Trebonia sp.]